MNATISAIASKFPKAVPNADLATTVSKALKKYNYGSSNTQLATALCSDELARPLEDVFAKLYGPLFSMGGLSGFPYAGLTGFGAMASHIPTGGSCLLVYGPHVGVSAYGTVGTVDRRGLLDGGPCCGSACAAAAHVVAHTAAAGDADDDDDDDNINNMLDAQQTFVTSKLLPFASRLKQAENTMVELPYALFEAQDEMMIEIVRQAGHVVAGNGKIAFLGGIQINTDPTLSDYFLPLRFDIREKDGTVLEDLL